MALAGKGPKLFTCPRCRKAYLGHDPLPDCPSCGYDYRVKGGFRWDVLVYLLSVLGLISYLLVSSSYRTLITAPASSNPPSATTGPGLLFRAMRSFLDLVMPPWSILLSRA